MSYIPYTPSALTATQKATAKALYVKFCNQRNLNPNAPVLSNNLLVTDPGMTYLEEAQIITPAEYAALVEEFEEVDFEVVPFNPVTLIEIKLFHNMYDPKAIAKMLA